MLEIKNLHASINGKEILKGLSLSVKPGEIHAIMGPNGSGKSTLSSVITGNPAFEVTQGSIVFEGKDLQEAMEMYQQFADASEGAKQKETFLELAKMEKGHKVRLEGIYTDIAFTEVW